MELNDEAKSASAKLGEAINAAIGSSREVNEALENLREMGYEPHISLKLEIALNRLEEEDEDTELELTDDDIKTLQRMKIRVQ